MSTKMLTGAYPAGYNLNTKYTILDIGVQGVVGGTGVTTSAAHPQTVTNEGQVTGTTNGVELSDGGRITNGSPTNQNATISGPTAVLVTGPATVTNYGTIASSTGATGTAISLTNAGDLLVEESTGVITGKVVGGGGTLLLGAGSASVASATISGLGSKFTDFANIIVGTGQGWNFVGQNTIDSGVTLKNNQAIVDQGTLTNDGRIALGSLLRLDTGAQLVNNASGIIDIMGDTNISHLTSVTGTDLVNAGLIDKEGGTGVSQIKTAVDNTGTIIAGSGTLDVVGAVTGMGSFNINSGDVLQFGAGVGANSRVNFIGSNATLALTGAPGAFAGSVSGFAAGDTLDLAPVPFGAGTTVSFSQKAHTLTVSNGGISSSVTLLGQYAASGFGTASNGAGGTDITYTAPAAAVMATPLVHG